MTAQANLIQLHETLEIYIDDFLLDCKKNSESTYKNYKCDIGKLASDMFNLPHYKYITKEHIESLSISDLINYFNACYQEEKFDGTRKYSNGTISRRISSLKSMIKYLVGREVIDYNIQKLYTFLKTLPNTAIKIDVLSDEDSERCIEHFKTFPMGDKLYLLGKLAIDTALRANELLTLKWNQFTVIDDFTVVIESRGTTKGKGNKDWLVEIHIDLYNELLELKQDNSELLFDLSYSTLAQVMNRTTEALGLNDKNYTFHSFRKNSITYTYNLTNGDILAAKEKGNHSSVATTEGYIKANKYGATGRYSVSGKVDNEAFMKASHNDLLLALNKLDEGTLLRLNMELSKLK